MVFNWASRICKLVRQKELAGSGMARLDWTVQTCGLEGRGTELKGGGMTGSMDGRGVSRKGETACWAEMPVGHVIADMPIQSAMRL